MSVLAPDLAPVCPPPAGVLGADLRPAGVRLQLRVHDLHVPLQLRVHVPEVRLLQ